MNGLVRLSTLSSLGMHGQDYYFEGYQIVSRKWWYNVVLIIRLVMQSTCHGTRWSWDTITLDL